VNSDVHETMETAFSGAELQSTLYPTEQGLKRSSDYPDEPMLSVAAKFQLDPVKNVKVRACSLGKESIGRTFTFPIQSTLAVLDTLGTKICCPQ